MTGLPEKIRHLADAPEDYMHNCAMDGRFTNYSGVGNRRVARTIFSNFQESEGGGLETAWPIWHNYRGSFLVAQ